MLNSHDVGLGGGIASGEKGAKFYSNWRTKTGMFFLIANCKPQSAQFLNKFKTNTWSKLDL